MPSPNLGSGSLTLLAFGGREPRQIQAQVRGASQIFQFDGGVKFRSGQHSNCTSKPNKKKTRITGNMEHSFEPLQNDLILRAAWGQSVERPPIWVMRQGEEMPSSSMAAASAFR